MEIVVACELNGGIGQNGKIPWNNKEDLRRFYKLTTTCPTNKINTLIMGRKTWESLPHKPLKNRINIIMTRSDIDITTYDPKYVKVFNSKDAVIKYLLESYHIHKVFVIGGSQIYDLFWDETLEIHMTMIKDFYRCDTHIDLKKMNKQYKVITKENHEDMSYVNLKRKFLFDED